MADEAKGKEKEESQQIVSAVDFDVSSEIAALEEEEERKKGEGEEGGEEEPMVAGKKRRMRKYHQTRAHANPLSDHRFPWCPISPEQMNWFVFVYACVLCLLSMLSGRCESMRGIVSNPFLSFPFLSSPLLSPFPLLSPSFSFPLPSSSFLLPFLSLP